MQLSNCSSNLKNYGDPQYTYFTCAGVQFMIDDGGMLTLWVYDSGDELDEGDVVPCGGVMKRTSSTFIFLTQDLWALPHQVLQESQVTLLSQLDSNVEYKNNRKRRAWYARVFLL